VHLGLAVDAMSARRQLLSIAKGTGYVDGLTQVN
jgi:hypothetical protein